MTQLESLQAILTEVLELGEPCGLQRENMLVNGSASMVLHGMDRQIDDVDLFVPTRVWFKLRDNDFRWNTYLTNPWDSELLCDPPFIYRWVQGVEVNVFFAWRRRGYVDIDVADEFRRAVNKSNFLAVPLRQLRRWKVEAGRWKDIHDVHEIDRFLNET